MENTDVIIVGAGAAGLMCAIEAGKRGRSVVVLDHANKPGKKILMSGGGRCNFTNLHINPNCYISNNPHFCKSALSRYTQWDFIDLVNRHHIPYHEKTLGQLFCDEKSKAILEMLLIECERAGVEIRLHVEIERIEKVNDHHFKIYSTRGDFHSQSLVIASGGLSIPTMGASPFAYKVAEQFGIKVWPTRAGLVPFTLQPEDKHKYDVLSGVSADCLAHNVQILFRENMLFTHRGLSGPAILQLSSYWLPGETITINLLPDKNMLALLIAAKNNEPQKLLKNVVAGYLPKRILDIFLPLELSDKKIATIAHKDLEAVVQRFQQWLVKPNGTEGYRTAEVTLGGIECDALSSKTMEVNEVKGLYFIGEAVDVTGWLGGYNFQWAWSSGWAAGQVV